jgi:hypothetical protein
MYTTKIKISNLLGIDVAAIKDEWLVWSDIQVDKMTGKTFTEVIVTDKKYDGPGGDELVLNEYPITEVTKIYYLTQYQPTEIWYELDAQYYRLYSDEGIIKLTPDLSGLCDIAEFEEGVQNFKISYKYGYTTVPSIIEFLASLYAAQMYQLSTYGASGTISSEKIGDYSVSYSSDGNEVKTSDLIKDILKQVARSNIGIRII